MLKISISGVRGIANESLTPEICLNFAKAFGTYLKGGKIVVGIDPRPSSEFIKGIVIEGLVSCGLKVIDLGMVPTPTVGIMVRELNASGGLMITASHNPPEWNGLKFFREDGMFFNQSQLEKLLLIYKTQNFKERDGGSLRNYAKACEVHIKKILKAINPLRLRRKKFKVVYDACNGAGSYASAQLLKKLGCRVIAINADPRKPFPRGAEPTPSNITALCEAVKKEGADLGFAQDPDADRLALVNERGEAISEEYTLVLCADYILSQNQPGPKIIVANLSTTRALDDLSKRWGTILIRTKIGEIHVAEEMKKVKAVIGGEGNGGVIYPRVSFLRDSLTGMALILSALTQGGQKLSGLMSDIPQYFMYKTKISCASPAAAEDLIDKTREFYKKETQDLTDGVKIYLPEATLHVRASNTEPILRIITEAKSYEAAKRLAEDLVFRLQP